jgi:hypothetical protein
MTDVERTIEAICRIPIDFHAEGVSELDLVRRSGYLTSRGAITVKGIDDVLRRHPGWVDAWFGLSDDQRSSPASWVDEHGPSAYAVGYYDASVDLQQAPLVFDDRVAACAEFVSRHLDAITQTIERVEAMRRPGESDRAAATRLTRMKGGRR